MRYGQIVADWTRSAQALSARLASHAKRLARRKAATSWPKGSSVNSFERQPHSWRCLFETRRWGCTPSAMPGIRWELGSRPAPRPAAPPNGRSWLRPATARPTPLYREANPFAGANAA